MRLAALIEAELRSAARRPDELALLLLASVAAGVLGRLAGGGAVYLAALLASQLSAYLYLIRDWDRGILEGMVHYVGYAGIYVSKLAVVSATALGGTAVSSLFIQPSLLPQALAAAAAYSGISALAALLSCYGGLPATAAAAASSVLAVPPTIRLAEGAGLPALTALLAALAVGLLAAHLLDWHPT